MRSTSAVEPGISNRPRFRFESREGVGGRGSTVNNSGTRPDLHPSPTSTAAAASPSPRRVRSGNSGEHTLVGETRVKARLAQARLILDEDMPRVLQCFAAVDEHGRMAVTLEEFSEFGNLIDVDCGQLAFQKCSPIGTPLRIALDDLLLLLFPSYPPMDVMQEAAKHLDPPARAACQPPTPPEVQRLFNRCVRAEQQATDEQETNKPGPLPTTSQRGSMGAGAPLSMASSSPWSSSPAVLSPPQPQPSTMTVTVRRLLDELHLPDVTAREELCRRAVSVSRVVSSCIESDAAVFRMLRLRDLLGRLHLPLGLASVRTQPPMSMMNLCLFWNTSLRAQLSPVLRTDQLARLADAVLVMQSHGRHAPFYLSWSASLSAPTPVYTPQTPFESDIFGGSRMLVDDPLSVRLDIQQFNQLFDAAYDVTAIVEPPTVSTYLATSALTFGKGQTLESLTALYSDQPKQLPFAFEFDPIFRSEHRGGAEEEMMNSSPSRATKGKRTGRVATASRFRDDADQRECAAMASTLDEAAEQDCYSDDERPELLLVKQRKKQRPGGARLSPSKVATGRGGSTVPLSPQRSTVVKRKEPLPSSFHQAQAEAIKVLTRHLGYSDELKMSNKLHHYDVCSSTPIAAVVRPRSPTGEKDGSRSGEAGAARLHRRRSKLSFHRRPSSQPNKEMATATTTSSGGDGAQACAGANGTSLEEDNMVFATQERRGSSEHQPRKPTAPSSVISAVVSPRAVAIRRTGSFAALKTSATPSSSSAGPSLSSSRAVRQADRKKGNKPSSSPSWVVLS